MPAALVKSFAKKHGCSVDTAEKYWKEAKKATNKSYDESEGGKYWGTVTKIFKTKMKKHVGKKKKKNESKILSFEDYLNESNSYGATAEISYPESGKEDIIVNVDDDIVDKLERTEKLATKYYNYNMPQNLEDEWNTMMDEIENYFFNKKEVTSHFKFNPMMTVFNHVETDANVDYSFRLENAEY
jgi:hypothetical protein